VSVPSDHLTSAIDADLDGQLQEVAAFTVRPEASEVVMYVVARCLAHLERVERESSTRPLPPALCAKPARRWQPAVVGEPGRTGPATPDQRSSGRESQNGQRVL
jgi:hypothetical protein